MCSTFTNSMGDCLQTLTDGYNEGGRDRRAVDPISAEVLGLKTGVGTVDDFEVSISRKDFDSWDMSSDN